MDVYLGYTKWSKMKHAMIDLETLGTSADAVWLSIAAIQFDPHTGEMGARFNANVDLASAQKAGRTISSDTLKWWLKQRPEILAKMLDPDDVGDLDEVLTLFRSWVLDCKLITPWGNSASFDLGILTHSYAQAGIKLPWFFYHEKCYRTITTLAGVKAVKDESKAHDPEYDCEIQIAALAKAYKILNIKP